MKEYLDAVSETLHVVANTLLLHETLRSTIAAKSVNGGDVRHVFLLFYFLFFSVRQRCGMNTKGIPYIPDSQIP
jgi:hypothetical protein